MEEITAIRLCMVRGLTGAAIQIIQLIGQDLKQALLVMAEKFQTEEAVQKIKVSITIATGKEIQTKIHRGQCGVIILTVQAVTRAVDGITVHPIQQEDKVLIGEIILQGVQLIVVPEVAQWEVVLPEAHHRAVVEVDRGPGVGINFKLFYV